MHSVKKGMLMFFRNVFIIHRKVSVGLNLKIRSYKYVSRLLFPDIVFVFWEVRTKEHSLLRTSQGLPRKAYLFCSMKSLRIGEVSALWCSGGFFECFRNAVFVNHAFMNHKASTMPSYRWPFLYGGSFQNSKTCL